MCFEAKKKVSVQKIMVVFRVAGFSPAKCRDAFSIQIRRVQNPAAQNTSTF